MTVAEIAEHPPRYADMDDVAFDKRGCCWFMSSGSCWWERVMHGSQEREEVGFWARAVKGVKKVREWSELMAGPKWKTFIRRFGKNRGGRGKFQYDPMSYSLNFDEGHGQDGLYSDLFRDFSSRYASLPVLTKCSMDLGKDGPSFE